MTKIWDFGGTAILVCPDLRQFPEFSLPLLKPGQFERVSQDVGPSLLKPGESQANQDELAPLDFGVSSGFESWLSHYSCTTPGKSLYHLQHSFLLVK